METCEASRLRTGAPALGVTIRISSPQQLQQLRDGVLNGQVEKKLNERVTKYSPHWQLQVDRGRFLELYEESMLKASELTAHQRERLEELETTGDAHLSAPAGAGKTFVAIQRVLDTLAASPTARVLYVSPSLELAQHFLRWLSMRLSAQLMPQEEDLMEQKLRDILKRLKVMHRPFEALRMPKLDGEKVFYDIAGGQMADSFDLAVFDEAHHIFCPETESTGLLQAVVSGAAQKLLLSDASQASATAQSFPRLREVRLTEVVRSTRRIVSGAAAFALSADTGEPAVSLGSDGPPLTCYLFAGESMELYATHVVKALRHIDHNFPGVSWHRRVALLGPDDEFVIKLRRSLKAALSREILHRRVRLVSFADSLQSLPMLHQRSVPDLEQSIVVDTVDHADGLEQLVVIAMGLDVCIEGTATDLMTRSRLYRALTRAQLLAIVVNHEVEGGWLQFLGCLNYKDAGNLGWQEEAPPNFQEAAKIREEAIQKDAGQAEAGRTAEASEKAAEDAAAQGEDKEKTAPTEKKVEMMTSSVWDTTDVETKPAADLKFNPLALPYRSSSFARRAPAAGQGLSWVFRKPPGREPPKLSEPPRILQKRCRTVRRASGCTGVGARSRPEAASPAEATTAWRSSWPRCPSSRVSGRCT